MEVFMEYFNKVLTDHVAAPPPPPPRPSAPEPPPPQAAAPFEVGQFFVIHGLATRTELNNLEAIGQVLLPSERVQVKMASGELVSIKLQNLTQIPQPRKAWVCSTCKKNAYWSEGAGPRGLKRNQTRGGINVFTTTIFRTTF